MIVLPKNIIKRIQEEANRLGMSYEEYLIDLVTQGLDPRDKAIEYIEAAKELLEQTREELERDNIRQAAEKLWGATALSIKAYALCALWRDRKRLSSHRELWEYKKKLVKELGNWISNVFYAGQSMHVCFYEGWCSREDVEEVIDLVKKLVETIASKIKD